MPGVPKHPVQSLLLGLAPTFIQQGLHYTLRFVGAVKLVDEVLKDGSRAFSFIRADIRWSGFPGPPPPCCVLPLLLALGGAHAHRRVDYECSILPWSQGRHC